MDEIVLQRKKKFARIDKIIEISLTIITIVTMFSLFRVADVPSGSMRPTLDIHEYAFTKVIYSPDEIDYGDIVTFRINDAAGKEHILIKRLIGKPGDTVEVRTDGVYRNGEKLYEPYRPESTTELTMEPITLGETQYFLMGDNWNNSTDCRVFGPIDESQLFTKMLFHFNLFD